MYYDRREPDDRDEDSREALAGLSGHEDDHYLVDCPDRIKIGRLELRAASNEYGVWTKNLNLRNPS